MKAILVGVGVLFLFSCFLEALGKSLPLATYNSVVIALSGVFLILGFGVVWKDRERLGGWVIALIAIIGFSLLGCLVIFILWR